MQMSNVENEEPSAETKNETLTNNVLSNEAMIDASEVGLATSIKQETELAAIVDDSFMYGTAPPPHIAPTKAIKLCLSKMDEIAQQRIESQEAKASTKSQPPPNLPDTPAATTTNRFMERGIIGSKTQDHVGLLTFSQVPALNSNFATPLYGNVNRASGKCCGRSGSVALPDSNIKTSYSMTSLPPVEKQECHNVIQAKLEIERPYNSLKKTNDKKLSNNFNSMPKTEANSKYNKNHRSSWGSGYSHSSSSLQSSTTLGLGSGKDDLWAAIQTNYNYIMDTNLLDTCKEARCELEGASSVVESPIKCCFEMLHGSDRSEGTYGNLKELRKWLREMEQRLECAPSLSEATMFGSTDLQRHLSVYTVLYHEIVSHARVVRACIRAASESEQAQLEQQNLFVNDSSIAEQTNLPRSSPPEDGATQNLNTANVTNRKTTETVIITAGEKKSSVTYQPSLSTSSAVGLAPSTIKKNEEHLERLQNRYHLVYLKAFELQLWLDGLLRKKGSTTSIPNDESSADIEDDLDGTDEEFSECGVAEDDLNNLASDLGSVGRNNSSSSSELHRDNIEHDHSTADKQHKISSFTKTKLLKSTDASTDDDDDEGWLYSTVPHTQPKIEASELNFCSFTTLLVDDLLSSTVTSSCLATVTGSALAHRIDSDKENNEAAVFNPFVNALTPSHPTDCLQETFANSVQLAAATAKTATDTTNNTVMISSAASTSSQSSICSICSSNDLHTETTTSATTTTQITQMELPMNRPRSNNNNKTHAETSTVKPIVINQHTKYNHEMKHQYECAEATSDEQKDKFCNYASADIYNFNVTPTELSPGNRLPPRSPAKLIKSLNSNTTKVKVSHESIKQLVLDAEHLVRDDTLKTHNKERQKRDITMPGPIKQRVKEWLEHQPLPLAQTHKSHDQVSGTITTNHSHTDDCEASGETSETDSFSQPSSDTSEGFTDSIATYMQTSTNSYGNSTELIGGSAEPIMGPVAVLGYGSSNQSLNVKVVKRQQTRRKSERPWSVSCLSQLTTDVSQESTNVSKQCNVQTGLATYSISESALDSLSPGRPCASSSSKTAHSSQIKKYDKGSLKRRRARRKKHFAGKKTNSGSEETNEVPTLTQPLMMKYSETMTPQQIHERKNTLFNSQNSTLLPGSCSDQIHPATVQHAQQLLLPVEHPYLQPGSNGSDDDDQLMKPNFRVGDYTTTYMTSEARLGSLAALATYMNEDEQQGEYTTGTEDHHSSFSETAWDNYQEKYNSENYSEGFDSDAARRLMEFGDDYRNFIDSQSDCCSSLSAANNLDSLSPPRMDSLQQNDTKVIMHDKVTSSVDHARRRRALELEYERRRKTLEVRRKSFQDPIDCKNSRSPTISLSSSANALTPKNTDKISFQHKSDTINRKLEFGLLTSHSAHSLRRTSESDTSTRRRKADERRRSSRNMEKCIKAIPATSSSSYDSDDEKEMRYLLQQSRNRLDDTRALKLRCHLLRPEDYSEIVTTCRDNIRCLESVLRGTPGSVLSTQCSSQTKDLLDAWEDLLGWSENVACARKMQEEIIILKQALIRLGNKASYELLDAEPSIKTAIESLQNEKLQMQTYRTTMLRLNASVHSWLTRQERKLQTAFMEHQSKEALDRTNVTLTVENSDPNIEQTMKVESEKGQDQQNEIIYQHGPQPEPYLSATSSLTASMLVGASTAATVLLNEKGWELHSKSENEFHKHLKSEVSEMYSVWDDADARINMQLDALTASLIAWRQLECGLLEFQQALGQDRGTLQGLEGALKNGKATPVELAKNVKLVAKFLSEKVNISQEQLAAVHEHLDPKHILHLTQFKASNGSLSDSGISDGGTISDGGLSERERRLGILRRFAKQLESTLAPGSDAMKSIAARMESAEEELKNLQNSCRDLIVRTAASHQIQKQNKLQTQLRQHSSKTTNTNSNLKINCYSAVSVRNSNEQASKSNSPTNRKANRKQNRTAFKGVDSIDVVTVTSKTQSTIMNRKVAGAIATSNGDWDLDDDSTEDFCLDKGDRKSKVPKQGWAFRIAKVAVPVQLAFFTLLCAVCLLQPNCCDNLNNFSMSFTPQLRYIRGPPPT